MKKFFYEFIVVIIISGFTDFIILKSLSFGNLLLSGTQVLFVKIIEIAKEYESNDFSEITHTLFLIHIFLWNYKINCIYDLDLYSYILFDCSGKINHLMINFEISFYKIF